MNGDGLENVIENANNKKLRLETEAEAVWMPHSNCCCWVKLVAAISRLSGKLPVANWQLQLPSCHKQDLLSGASRNVHNEALK